MDALIDQKVPAPRGWRRALLPVALLLGICVADRGGRAATNSGIDPLDVLDLTVKNNVLFVLDTSGSMASATDSPGDSLNRTGDDPITKLYQAKDAIKQVVKAQNGKVNFGFATFNILNADKKIAAPTGNVLSVDGAGKPNQTTYNGALIYVSADQYAQDWAFGPNAQSGFFNGMLPGATFADYDTVDNSTDTFRSFGTGIFPPGQNNPTASPTIFGGYPNGCVAQNGALSGKILSPIDLSTPSNMRCRFYLRSQLYRNSTLFRWNRSLGQTGMISRTAITCPLPPAGLVGFNPDNNGDGLADNPVPCIQLQDNTTPTRIATFFYSGTNFDNSVSTFCGGAGLISAVSSCDDPTGAQNQAVIDSINKAMDPAVPVAGGKLNFRDLGLGSGPGGMEVTAGMTGSLASHFQLVGVTPPQVGVSGTQSTPIGNSLLNVRTTTVAHPAGGVGMFPPRPAAAAGIQKNFVIVVTDGDDTCEDPSSSTQTPTAYGHSAVLAAKKAQDLFYNTKPGTVPGNWNDEPTDPQRQATTFVIAFGAGAAPANANVIAQAGTGAVIDTSQLEPANAVTCPAGATCRDAFLAGNTAQLVDALNEAIALASATATFAASPGVVDNVFEYAKWVPPANTFDPLDPATRFKTTAPVLVQPSFDMPGFKGHLAAYINKSTSPTCPAGATEPVAGTCQLWDAGQKLLDRLTRTAGGAACAPGSTDCMVPVTGEYTFSQLMGSATLATVATTTDLRIRRRIFTTASNGVNPTTLPLWPPTTGGSNTTCTTDAACQAAGNGVAPRNTGGPANTNPLGALDVALGIAGMTFNQLQTEFFACSGAGAPADCTDTSGTPPNTRQVRQAKMEAREIILAYTAGAEPVLAGGGLKRAGGFPLFKARSWMLAESSYASPAIVTRSPDKPTDAEKQEWILYRDGPRSSATGQAINNINLGFGNRNPDKDGTTTSVADLTLKPVMTVVLYPANDMLHAFRAGPCPVAAADCSGELGGEEMWGFVPFDQLGKLAPARKIQSRTTKVFMMASSMRFGDVFIKSADFTIQGVTYRGRWKKMAYFGRGKGGKYYTGLDLTLTGAFTNRSLKATLPTVLWNRGNPDTNDGKCKSGTAGCVGGSNTYANTVSTTAGAFDYNAYLGMGETWSTPAMARVDPLFNTTLRTPTASGGISFALYTGSGETDTPTEGSTFYALDAITGDVINSKNVGDNLSAASGVDSNLNTLTADAAAFAPNLLVAGSKLPNPANEIATRVYIGDVHGRLWRFRTDDPGFSTTTTPFADLGPDQPIGVAVGLLNYDSTGSDGVKPHVYVSTGGDSRVTVPPAFRMFGFKEESSGVATALPGFPIDFPINSTPPPPTGFRGTVQPSTAFNDQSFGRVFFTGTVFIPPDPAKDESDDPGPCVSSFASLIGALTAGTGSAAYDLSAGGDDRFVQIKGKVVTSPNTSTGKPEIVTGDRISAPPPPPPPPQQVGGLGTAVSVVGMGGPGGAPLYRMVSGVCN